MDTNRLTERFMDYVRCDSESRDERRFCEKLEAELVALGLEVRRDDVSESTGSNGFDIHARLNGTGKPLLFSCHMDTVFPGKGITPVIRDGVICSDGTTILGSDDKSGIAAVMESLHRIVEGNLPHRTIEVMFTVCEEIGLLGSKNADYSGVQSKGAIVLDSSMVGCVINRAPATARIHAKVTGKSAHAAISPDHGAHALKAACEAIANIPCGYIGDNTVMNVGTLKCEGKTNVVPALAEFDMEVRSFIKEELEAHISACEETLKKACEHYGTSYVFDVDRQCDVLYVNENSDTMLELLNAYRELGHEPTISRTYGGSDATWLFAHGIDAINIGTGMEDVHGLSEHINIENMVTTAELVFKLMCRQ